MGLRSLNGAIQTSRVENETFKNPTKYYLDYDFITSEVI